MPKHVKPSKKDLEEKAQLALEEAEKMEETPPAEEAPVVEEEGAEEKTPEPEEEKEIEPSPSIDYKKKFSESTREAQILFAKNRKVNEAVAKANEIPDPTEEDLSKEYPDWEMMTDLEKKLARDSLIASKRFAVIYEATKEFKDIDAWNTKVEEFIEDPKTFITYPALEKKDDEFKIFASKPTRRGMDFEDLVSAFLYDVSKHLPAKNKGSMFESGSGGPNESPRPKGDKLTVEEGRVLRKTDYNKWKEMLRQGKIDSEV